MSAEQAQPNEERTNSMSMADVAVYRNIYNSEENYDECALMLLDQIEFLISEALYRGSVIAALQAELDGDLN